MSSTEPAGPPPARTFGEALQKRIEILVVRPIFWVGLIVLVLLVPARHVFGGTAPRSPALHLPLPAFALTNERGERYGLSDLRGSVWIADFVFTSCPTVCPRLTKRMEELQH